MTNQEIKNITSESLRDWFKKEKWVRISTSGDIAGPCGTSKNKKNPDRCLPKAKAQSLTKGQRAATAAKKKKAGAKGKTVVKNTKKATVKKENTKLDEVAAPSTVPSNIMYSLNTTKGMSGNHRYHIGTLLQALHRGSTIQDMQPEEKFYLHTVKFNSNVTIFPKVVNEDPEEGYDDNFNIRDVGETDVVIYDNGVEGLDWPEPLPDGCKTANQSPNYSIYTHSKNFKVVKVEELTTGWDGDDYNDKTNQFSRALYAACKLEYIPDVDETKKATVKKEEYKGKHQGTNYKWPMSQATKDRKEADKKSSHKNSNAYKDAVAAGNAMKKEATFDDIKNLSYDSVKKTFGIRKKISQAILNFFPHEDHMVKVEYHGDYIEDEDELTVKQLLNYVDKRLDDNVINKDDIDVTPAKGKAPTLFIDAGENSFEITSLDDEEFFAETANPQDGKAAPHGSGYKKVTKEDIRNLVVGTIHEIQNEGNIEEKDDRCTRLAKQKYDTWPSAYASGAVVRCRRGEIWKKK